MHMRAKLNLSLAVLLFWIPLHGQWVKLDSKSYSDLSPKNIWARLIDYCQNDKNEELLNSELFRPQLSKKEILKLDTVLDDLFNKYDNLFYLIVKPKKGNSGWYDFHFYIPQLPTSNDKKGPQNIKLIKMIGFEYDDYMTSQIAEIIYYDLNEEELLELQKELNKFPPPNIPPPPLTPKNTIQKAQQAYLERDYDKAKHLYGIIINYNIEKYFFNAYLGRANCNYNQQYYEEAKSDVVEALKATPDIYKYDLHMRNSYWLYANIYSDENNIEKSLEYLKKATEFVESSKLYSSIAYDEIELNKYDDALVSLNKAINLNKNEPLAYSNRSLVYLNLGKLKKARADITKSIKLFDVNPYAYKHSAMIYIAEGKMDEACSELRKANQLVIPKNIHGSNHAEIQRLLIKHCN